MDEKAQQNNSASDDVISLITFHTQAKIEIKNQNLATYQLQNISHSGGGTDFTNPLIRVQEIILD